MNRILIVDDEEDYIFILTKVLKKAGYEVLIASNGLDGLAVAEKEKPDLVILDINMPGLSGFEAAEKIRAIDSLKNMPIIMLTVRNKVDDQITGLSKGGDDYIMKPFVPAELLSRVGNLLRFRQEVLKNE